MASGDKAAPVLSKDLKIGAKVIEGKTKVVYELTEPQGEVVLYSKDRITCGDGARAHDLEGKAAISTATTSTIFKLLNNAGVKTHFIRQHSEREFIAHQCDMVPIEWVTRRVATGSFLKRHPGVKEGYRFCPPKQETFFKDDANHDPQWSREQLVDAQLKVGDKTIGPVEIDVMQRMTLCVFEILEHVWQGLDCSLIDMKVEYGVSRKTGEIVLADIIDSDSWRLWPAGDKRLMVDKQVYRNMKEVTQEGLDTVKRNFQWVAEKVKELSPAPQGQAVIIMGSPTDKDHCQKICNKLKSLSVPCQMRVTSAHKGTDATMKVLAEYEGGTRPTVFIAVAGRSNGLGPVLSGNATWPVINAPPVSHEWAAEDIWSSLRLPSGLGCTTVLSPDAAALAAAQMLSLHDNIIWSRLRAEQCNTWIKLRLTDGEFTKNGHGHVTNGYACC